MSAEAEQKRVCACGCGADISHRRRDARWLNTEHYNRTPHDITPIEERGKARPRTALIHALRAEVPKDLCVYCERPLPPGHTIKCAREQCTRDYWRDYEAERRRLQREARQAPVDAAEPGA